ncbi:unnamed protein product, partial [Pylaiella littoralis]
MEMKDGKLVEGRSDTYVGRCPPCQEYPDGLMRKSVREAVEILENLLPDLEIDCKEGGPEYNRQRSARVILRVGVNFDGYWTCDDLCKQLKALFVVFELSREPGRQMFNIFDNSTGHAAYSPDALRAQNVAAGAGGQQAVPRPFVHEGRRIPTVFEEGSVL